MFCPHCTTEYRAGFSRCSDCGAQLVQHLDAPVPKDRPQAADGPELLWTGTDMTISGAITAALNQSGIPHHTQTRDVGLLPGLAQPAYAIFVPARHHNAAQAVLEEARRQFEDGQEELSKSTSDSESSNDPQGKDQSAFLDSAADAVPEEYDPNDATAEVWSGNDAHTKDMLIASLHENGIGCELDSENHFRIRVMLGSAPRAREIVREVTEASPPA